MEASFYYLLFHTISSQILVDYYASEVMPDYDKVSPFLCAL